MFMTIEVQHAITEGKEKEALQVIKHLYSEGLDYPGDESDSLGPGLVISESISPGLEIVDGYRNHLGKVFSQVRRVASPNAKIKVRLTT